MEERAVGMALRLCGGAVTACRMHDAHVRAVRHVLRDDSAHVGIVHAASDVWYGRPNWVLLLSNVPLALWGGFNWKIHLLSYTLSYVLWTILHRRK